jgi:ERCC4-type nuclease
MSKNVKVTVLKAFDSGGKEYLPGAAEVPADAVQKLAERGLIAADGIEPVQDVNTADVAASAAQGNAVIAMLEKERLEGEASNLQTLERIIAERDELRAEVEQLRANISNAGDENKSPSFAEALEEKLGKKAAVSILDAGFDSPDKLAAATNEQLLALDDVGEQTVKKIRENLKANTE